MLKTHALAHYDNNHTRLAAAIRITRSAVSQWGPVVPYFAAVALEEKTKGKLKVDPALYERGRPVQQAA